MGDVVDEDNHKSTVFMLLNGDTITWEDDDDDFTLLNDC